MTGEKNLEKILKKQREEYQCHLGALSEDFHSGIKLISEQYGSIMEVLEKHTQDIEAIKEKIISTDIWLGYIEDNLRGKVPTQWSG